MSTLDTARSWTTAGTDQPVVMPRRHVIAIAILMCVPLPLFSLAATVVPLPQLVQRAAMSFVSLAAPTFGRDRSLIRERADPVRSVRITYRSSERAASSVIEVSAARVKPTPTRGAAARGGYAKALVRVDPGTSSSVKPTRPAGKTGDTAPPESGEDPRSVDPPTGGGSPTGTEPGPTGARPESPSSPPAPGGGGTGGGQTGSGGSSAGPGGGSSSGGGGSGGGADSGKSGSGGTTTEPPSAGAAPPGQGGTSPGGGNADPAPGAAGPGTGPGTGPGAGNGSPPESPPGQGAGSGNGSGSGKP